MQALLMPLAGNRLEGVSTPYHGKALSFPFNQRGVIPCCQGFTCQATFFTGVGQAHIRIDAESQRFFLASEKIPEPPVSAAVWHDKQKQAPAVRQLVRS